MTTARTTNNSTTRERRISTTIPRRPSRRRRGHYRRDPAVPAGDTGSGAAGRAGRRAISHTVQGGVAMQNERYQEPNPAGGHPGDDVGRREFVGGSGVYPATGPRPEGRNLPVRMAGEWGQGARGPAGYDDHGESELMTMPPQGVRVYSRHPALAGGQPAAGRADGL